MAKNIIKLPKTVQICGMTYSVKTDKNTYDGAGTTCNPSITVGTKSKNKERYWEIFLHEVMEVAACERNYRYGGRGSENSLFVMSHKEFDSFARDIATAIRPMIGL